MEDATYVSEPGPTTSGQCAFYGVFDGHGGRAAADFVGARLVPNIRAAAGPRVSGDALQKSMRDAYFQTDREFREAASEEDAASGATALRGACARLKDAAGSELTFQAYADENLRWWGGGCGGTALPEGHAGSRSLIMMINRSVIIAVICDTSRLGRRRWCDLLYMYRVASELGDGPL